MALTAFPPSIYRLPFIIVNAIMGHITVTPPNRPPDSKEQQRYHVKARSDILTIVTPWYAPTLWIVMHGMNLAELYVTLATAFPNLQSPMLISFLLPSKYAFAPLVNKLQVTPVFVVGSLLSCFAGLLRLACYRTLGRHFTFELSVRKEHKLITAGPYSIVRHPAYLGSVCYFTGLLLCQFSSGSWWTEGNLWSTGLGKVVGAWWLTLIGFLLVSMVVIRVPKEDRVMREEFGKQWVEWAKRTPYKVVPGIY